MISIQHTAPTSAPRRDTIHGKYAPPANHWLRMIYAALVRIRCLLTCTDGVETANATNEDGELVPALDTNPRSKKVVVYNGNDVAQQVFEAGVLVAIVAPGETRELAMPGLLAITVQAVASAGTGPVQVTRYLRCACGDVEVEYTAEPVGSFLL